jgi:hypothetical protein
MAPAAPRIERRDEPRPDHVDRDAPAYNTVFKYAERAELAPLLQTLVHEPAAPLRAVETTFATDSTGFTSLDRRLSANHEDPIGISIPDPGKHIMRRSGVSRVAAIAARLAARRRGRAAGRAVTGPRGTRRAPRVAAPPISARSDRRISPVKRVGKRPPSTVHTYPFLHRHANPELRASTHGSEGRRLLGSGAGSRGGFVRAR